MSTKSILITIIIIILIALGVWYFIGQSNTAAPYSYQSASVVNGTSSTQANTSTATANSSANSSIDQDMASVDAQMSALSTDSNNADQGLNDKPISE